jgi:hypothetical protein
MESTQTGQIDVYRPHKFYALLRSYSIWIDGKKVKAIGDGERVFITIPQGLHNVFVKMGLKKSNSIELNITPGHTIKLLVWYRPFKGFRSIGLKCLYIAFIIIGAMIPIFIGIGTALLVLHRTGKLHLYEIKT